jgi:DNA-binding beta-propeller fold protein YncE
MYRTGIRNWAPRSIVVLLAAVLASLAIGVSAASGFGFITAWGTKGSGNGQFNSPASVSVDNAGNAYVADYANNNIQKFGPGGTFITSWGSNVLSNPLGVEVNPAGTLVYVADTFHDRVVEFDSSGNQLNAVGTFGGPASTVGHFNQPYAVTVEPSGNVLVVDNGNNRLQRFNSSLGGGAVLPSSGGLVFPNDVATDSADNIFVADRGNQRIVKYNSTTSTILAQVGAPGGARGSGDGQFNDPDGVATDPAGNVWVVDNQNFRIQKFTNSLAFSFKTGSMGSCQGQFELPLGIGTDTAGNVFVADTNNERIQEFGDSGNPNPPCKAGGGGGGGGANTKCAGKTATIVGTDAADKLTGTSGNDVIVGLGGSDRIKGKGGNDRICGGDGADKLKGGGGKDKLRGQKGKDRVRGNGGDKDKASGGPGADIVSGGGGSGDKCAGGPGVDVASPSCEKITGVP